jgi:DNA-binding CsgD family transcriptional regulator
VGRVTRLTSIDHERLLAELPGLYALCPREHLPARVLAIAHRLIGCDGATFNEIELATGEFRTLSDPGESVLRTLAPMFSRYMHQHPVIAHHAVSGDPRPYAISDLLRARDWRRLDLHGEFFAPLGIADQLATTLQAVPGVRVVGLAVDRPSDFTVRDRVLLDALRPHLATAYRNSVDYSHALATASVDQQSAEQAGSALARLTDRQVEVLGLIAAGHTNAQIALELDVSIGTVKKHVEHILQRLQTATRLAAARTYLAGSPTRPSPQWWNINGTAHQPLPRA